MAIKRVIYGIVLVSNSGTYTEDILSGKWTPVHQDL